MTKKTVNLLKYSVPVMLMTCLLIGSARAQSINYNSLETIFGGPVTTGATGTAQREADAPANMTIITADEIRQSGSRNIPEILSRVPGLDILQTGATVYDVGVRGYQTPFQPRLLVLVDGRQVFIDDYARTLWDNIPVNVDDIRQIEVVKGAASALYGSNAAGGVINIITYSPIYDNDNVVNVGFGTLNALNGDATVTHKGDWGGSKFSIGGLNEREFGSARYSLDANPKNAEHSYITNNTVLQINPHLQGFTEATFSHSVGYTADPTDNSIMGTQDTTTYSLRGGADWQTKYGLVNFNNYLNHTFSDLSEPTDGGAPYGFTTNTFVSQLQHQVRVNAYHTLRFGLEYRYKNFKMDGASLAPEAPAIAENNYAMSGVWVWKVGPRVTLSNAFRLDHLNMRETGQLVNGSPITIDQYSHIINTWSANSDAVYKATDLDSFRIGYGRGVQMPSLINSGYGLYQNFGTPSSVTLSDWQGNPKLKPTAVIDYSADYTRKLPEVKSELKFGIFYDINQDIVSPLQQTGTAVISGNTVIFGQSLNVGSSRAYGGEVQLKGHADNGVRWDASYSLSRVIDGSDVLQWVDYQGSAPIHQFRLGLGYTTGQWELDGLGQYLTQTNMLRSPDGGNTLETIKTRAYTTLSGRVGYKLTDAATVAVSGTNLGQHYTATSPYPKVERRLMVSLTDHF